MDAKKAIALIVIALAIGGWVLWQHRANVLTESSHIRTSPAKKTSTLQQRLVKVSVPQSRLDDSDDGTDFEVTVLADKAEDVSEHIRIMDRFSNSANVSIQLIAKIIDQDGAPVSGATVTYEIQYASVRDALRGRQSIKTSTTRSDAGGRFAIDGHSGYKLKILSIEKPGYEYKYSTTDIMLVSPTVYPGQQPAMGTAQNPRLFSMWRGSDKAALLVKENARHYIANDGRFYSLNLTTGAFVEGQSDAADLVFSCRRDAGDDLPLGWQCLVDFPKGGGISVIGKYPYSAPESGYQSQLAFGYLRNAKDWRASLEGAEVFVLSQGKYGRARITIDPFFSGGRKVALFISYWLNPGGSRNLHDDPAKRVPFSDERL